MAALDLRAWRRALAASDLTATPKHVGATLANYLDGDGSSQPSPSWSRAEHRDRVGAGPSLGTLAADCSRGKTEVRRALATLERAGWLACVHRGGNGRGDPHRWVAAMPGDPAPEPEARPVPAGLEYLRDA